MIPAFKEACHSRKAQRGGEGSRPPKSDYVNGKADRESSSSRRKRERRSRVEIRVSTESKSQFSLGVHLVQLGNNYSVS